MRAALHASAGGRSRREAFGRYRRPTLCADSVGAIRDPVSCTFEFCQVCLFLAEQSKDPRSLERERRTLRVVFIICVAISRSGDDVVELGPQRVDVSRRRSLLRIEKILCVPCGHVIN